MTKRWLSLVLVLTLLSTLFTGVAFAAPISKDVGDTKTLVTFDPAVTGPINAKPSDSTKLAGMILGTFKINGSPVDGDMAIILNKVPRVTALDFNGSGTISAAVDSSGQLKVTGTPSTPSTEGSFAITFKDLSTVTQPDFVAAYKFDVPNLTIATVVVANPVTKVEIVSYLDSDGYATGTMATPVLTPSGATVNSTEWKSSNTNIIAFTDASTGAYKLVGVGSATVTCTINGVISNSCSVRVNALAHNGVAIKDAETGNAPSGSVNAGTTMQLKAVFTSATSNTPTDTAVAWTVGNSEYCTVDKDGLVTFLKAGSSTVTVTGTEGAKKSDTVTFTIGTDPGTVVDPKYALENGTVGGTAPNLTATLTAADVLKATSSTSGATLYYTMAVGAVPADPTASDAVFPAAGLKLEESKVYNVKVIAIKGTAKSAVQNMTATVTIAPTGITLDKATATIEGKGELQLTATLAPANAAAETIYWNSDAPGVAAVANGKVTAASDGTTVITAYYGNATLSLATKKASCTVTVQNGSVKSIDVTPTTVTVKKGEKVKVIASVTPATAFNTAVIGEVATTDASKVAYTSSTAMADGKSEVWFTAGSTTGSALVYVTSSAKASVRKAVTVNVIDDDGSVSKPVFNFDSGTVFKKEGAEVIITAPDATATIYYTTDGSTPTTSSLNATGTKTITLDDNKATTIKAMAVKNNVKSEVATAAYSSEIAVSGISYVTSDTVSITGSGTGTCAVTLETKTIADGAGSKAPKNTNVTWTSSNESVVKFDSSSVSAKVVTATLKGIAAGTATVTATTEDGAFKQKFTVTVDHAGLIDTNVVKLYKGADLVTADPLPLNAKEFVQLTAKFFVDASGAQIYPTNDKVKWESNNEGVAKVDENGKIVAVAEGTAVITVTSLANSKVKVTQNIKVNPGGTQVAMPTFAAVSSATGAAVSGTLDTDSYYKYTEEVILKIACATDGAKIYYTLDGTTPTESSTAYTDAGIKLNRKTVVTARAYASNLDSATASYKIKFVTPATAVTLDKNELVLAMNETAKLTATLAPEAADSTAGQFAWVSSDNTKVYVSSTGALEARGVGEAKITVTYTNPTGSTLTSVSASCIVTVSGTAVTSVTVVPTSATLEVGEVKALSAIVLPTSLSDKNPTWSTSDATVVAINTVTGSITGKKAGTATITATLGGKTGTCSVTVKEATTLSEPVILPTFTATNSKFQAVEKASLTIELGRFTPGTGETWAQIAKYYNIEFTFTGLPTDVKPVVFVDANGVATMTIPDVGTANQTFAYKWQLKWNTNYGAAGVLDLSSRTVTGNTLTIVQKPTSITVNDLKVGVLDTSKATSVVLGTISNYADFVATGVNVTVDVAGLAGATATIGSDGKVTLSIPANAAKGEYDVTVTVSAAGCTEIKFSAVKVTVAEEPTPVNPVIVVDSKTKPVSIVVKKKAVDVYNFADGTATFKVAGATAATSSKAVATNWKSSKPKKLSIDSTTGVATFKKASSTVIKITCTYNGQTLTQLVRVQKLTTAMKMQYKDGKKWVDYALGTDAVKLEVGKKLVIRAVNVTGAKRYNPKWTSSDPTVVGPAKKAYTTLKGIKEGSATVTLTVNNDVTANILINVVPVGTKGAVESVEDELIEIDDIVEVEEIEELDD